jgi:hypothetical protein
MRLVKAVRGSALVTLLLFGLAACGESPMSPVPVSPALSPDVPGPLMARGGGAASDADDSHSGDARHGSRTFTIQPDQPLLKRLGDHMLWIPANVVCDPATSGYGPSSWDAPCRPIDRPIKVTAEWARVQGHEVIRFSTEVRFVPSADRSRWVFLWAKHSRNIDPTAYYAILWYDPEAAQWVDESISDPSLRALVDSSGMIVSRRLKHFSRYAVWEGRGSYNVTSGFAEALEGGNW